MRRTPAKRSSKLDMLVYLNTTLNTGHAHGLAKETIILPVLARDEEPQPTTQESMFNYVRLSDGGPRRHDGPRSEVEVIADIARTACSATTGPDRLARDAEHAARSARRSPKSCPASRRLGDDRQDEERIPDRRPHVPHAAVSHADGQGAVLHCTRCRHCRGSGRANCG